MVVSWRGKKIHFIPSRFFGTSNNLIDIRQINRRKRNFICMGSPKMQDPKRVRQLSICDPELKRRGRGAGPVAEWLGLCTPLQAAQCFVGSNPGRGHGTDHQAMLKQHPTCHN